MPSPSVVIAVSAVYLVGCLAVGLWPGRKLSETADGYVAGDRSLGLLVMYFITGATIFSAFAFLGAPGRAYSGGVSALFTLGYGTLGFIPFYFLGPRAARLGASYGFVTQAEMVATRFRMPSIAGVMALISTMAFIPYLALQMQGAGKVLNLMTDGRISEWQGAALIYGIVMIYVLKSGVLGVGWTNTFQGIFMMILAWVLGLYLPHKLYGGIGPMFERIANERPELLSPPGLTGSGVAWSWSEYSSTVLVMAVGFSFWPHLFMKAFTARDEKTIRRTVVLYPTFLIFLVPILLIGFSGVLFQPAPAEADQILPHLLMNLELPSVVVGLFCAGALAASMSTGDAIAHAAASIIIRDGLVTARGKRLGPALERRLIRIAIVVVLVASYLTAITYRGNLVKLLVYAYGPVVQFAPAVFASLYLRRAWGPAVLLGLIVGISTNIYFVRFPNHRPLEIHAGAYGLAANLALLALLSLLNRRAPHSEEERFLRIAAGVESSTPERETL